MIKTSEISLKKTKGVEKKIQQMKAGQELNKAQEVVNDKFGFILSTKGSEKIFCLDKGQAIMKTKGVTSELKSNIRDVKQVKKRKVQQSAQFEKKEK